MHRPLYLLIVVLAFVTQAQAQSTPAHKGQEPTQPWTIKGILPADKDYQLLIESLAAGQKRIEQFFGRPFVKPFEVEVFPNRVKFDEYFTTRWKVPKTQSWMVASGVGDKLTMLSRDVWKTQASEHNPRDDAHFRELIAHELVHVYHGQHNPTMDFDGMDDLGWFVEGLAVYVSGQLEQSHRQAAHDAIRLGKAPASLAQAWSGRYRYGVCGSMVHYLDQKMGRHKLIKLLAVTTPDQAMKFLQTTEKEFLVGWMANVKEQSR